MFSKIELDDTIAIIGLIIFLVGLYLWLGLAAPLMVLGLVMMYAGFRLDPAAIWSKNEPDQTTDTQQP